MTTAYLVTGSQMVKNHVLFVPCTHSFSSNTYESVLIPDIFSKPLETKMNETGPLPNRAHSPELWLL